MNRLLPFISFVAISLLFVGCGVPDETPLSPRDVAQTPQQELPKSPSLGDVAVVQTQLSDRLPLSGQVIVATTTIKNMGQVTSVAGHVRYYLSKDAAFGEGDRFLNTDALPRLKRGDSFVERVNLRVPGITEVGTYYILVVVKLQDSSLDMSESNNVKALRIEIRMPVAKTPAPRVQPFAGNPGYDWAIYEAKASHDVARKGHRISIACVVQNMGDRNLPVGRMRYYLSKDRHLDASDKYLNTDTIEALTPGASSPEQANMRVPDVASGHYFLLIVMDPTQEVAELDESNNTVALPFEIR